MNTPTIPKRTLLAPDVVVKIAPVLALWVSSADGTASAPRGTTLAKLGRALSTWEKAIELLAPFGQRPVVTTVSVRRLRFTQTKLSGSSRSGSA